MILLVVLKNGQKKYLHLTADAGAGNPVGTVIVVCSNQIPSNYLPLGTQYDTSLYPVLYALLGTDTTPTASALGLPTLTSGQYAIKATSGLSENAQDNVINTLNEQRSYSTEEVNTGKKWIDGKTIYSKVVVLPFTNSVSTGIQVSNEVSASDYQVIDLGHSYIYDADYGTRQPWASNATTQTNMYISSGRLSFETTHPSGTLYAVCEYTKTN